MEILYSELLAGSRNKDFYKERVLCSFKFAMKMTVPFDLDWSVSESVKRRRRF